MSLALRSAGPGGPAEKRGEVVDFLRVGDDLWDQPVFCLVGAEEVGVVRAYLLERAHLLGGELQCPAAFVVAIGPHHVDDGGGRVRRPGVAQFLADVIGGQPQVLRRVVRPEVATVAHHRAVLLQSAAQEDLLACGDLLLGVEGLAAGPTTRCGSGIESE